MAYYSKCTIEHGIGDKVVTYKQGDKVTEIKGKELDRLVDAGYVVEVKDVADVKEEVAAPIAAPLPPSLPESTAN